MFSTFEMFMLFWVLPSLCLLLTLSYLCMYIEDKCFEDVFDEWVICCALVLPVGLIALVATSWTAIIKFFNIEMSATKKLMFKKISFNYKGE